ncbi:toxic anion resistance protein [Sporofaciens sp. SGI.106]|uniref:toxic anion resistance protein n=1 Tax=Sporofaciens sp. SGI.106 TaxID=3420568 RepID=UPI003CFEB4FD
MNNENQGKTILTLSPDSSKRNLLDDTPIMQPAVGTSKQTGYSAGTIDESMLSDDERNMVDQFASEIDISDVDQVVKYGMAAQQNISDFSVTILKKVKTYDLGDVGSSLKELTIALDATTEPEKKGILGIFQKAKRGVESIRINYSKAESNVDRIEKDLRSHQNILIQDVAMYQQMYELNVQYYKELTMYIIAGKKALNNAKNGKLVELRSRADRTNMQEDVQAYKDFEDLCYRFEKKISDLELTRVLAIQSAPQVRMLQNNDREMLDKIQSSLANTIPLWRNQLVLSLGIEHSKRALEAQATLSDKTNDLLRRNSETLKMATIETAKEVERPIVDIETLRVCSNNLISSVNEVVKIHEQGATKRLKAQEELVKIEENLKQAMLESKYRQ